MLLGVLLVRAVRGWEQPRRRILSALVVGVLVANFYDLAKETAGLSGSTLRGVVDVLNVSFFAVALLGFYFAHQSLNGGGNLWLAYLWALLGVGLHGMGEGIVIGYDFATGFTILSLPQALSFTLHKIAEGASIGVLVYAVRVGLTQSVTVSLVAGLPVAVGTLLGLFGLPGGTSTFFFASSAGATVYGMTTLFTSDRNGVRRYAVWILVGFLYMYFAGVIHQFE